MYVWVVDNLIESVGGFKAKVLNCLAYPSLKIDKDGNARRVCLSVYSWNCLDKEFYHGKACVVLTTHDSTVCKRISLTLRGSNVTKCY